MAALLASGAVKSHDTVVEGLANMPDAFLGLFSGANIGKMLVRL
jgi:NADPH-dependent curcumin reductase CurA